MVRGLRGRPGGIVGLSRLLREYGEAVHYDLLALGYTPADLGGRLSWADLVVICRHAPPTSALARAVNPVSLTDLLLRRIEHNSRIGWWVHTADAEKGRNVPEQIPLTEDDVPEREKYDRMTPDEAMKFLGWEVDPNTGQVVVSRANRD